MTFPAVPASDEHNQHALTLWTQQVALILPAELTDVWLNGFPPFHTIDQEITARAAVLEQFAERLAMTPTGRCTPVVKAKKGTEGELRALAAPASWWRRRRIVRTILKESGQ